MALVLNACTEESRQAKLNTDNNNNSRGNNKSNAVITVLEISTNFTKFASKKKFNVGALLPSFTSTSQFLHNFMAFQKAKLLENSLTTIFLLHIDSTTTQKKHIFFKNQYIHSCSVEISRVKKKVK